MKNERVLLSSQVKDGIRMRYWSRIDQLVIPDIRLEGLFVKQEREQEVINCAYKHAVLVRDMILAREKGACHLEHFEIDIPYLWPIVSGICCRDQRSEIVKFSTIFRALVQHFMPKAKCVPYKHGLRYQGHAWRSSLRRNKL